MTAPRTIRLRRSLRRFTLGSGPLKRGSDRLQVLGRFLVVLSFLLAPPLAVATATRTTNDLQAVAETEAAERTRTRAVLLEDAPAPSRAGSDYGGTPRLTVPVPAVWSSPSGATREGTVFVRPRTPAGTSVPVWVGPEGALTAPPLDRAGIANSAAAVGVVPLVGVPLVAWTLYAVLCSALNSYRERRWAEGWAAVEPRWNSRLG